MEQRTQAWLEARRGRITGSRVGSVLDDNPYQSRDDVLRDMVREHFGYERDFQGNEATEHGTKHEPDARSAYEAETGNLVEEVGLIVHPSHDFLAASPDGLIDDDGSVEFKAPYRSKATEPPAHYWHQMQLVMSCAGRDWCDYFVWWPDNTALVHVERDEKWLRANLPELQSFIDEYHETIASDDLSKRHLEPLVDQRDDDEWRMAAAEYIEAKQAADDASKREKDARSALLKLTDRAAEGGGVKVTPYERAGSVDWGKLAKAHGLDDEADAYRKKSSTSWRITV